jgi:hypothetical protein
MNDPTFKHSSWDDYGFWQSVYFYAWDSKYRNTLQNAILEAFRAARADLGRLSNVQQANPVASLILQWNRTLATYSRGISCDEAERVKGELQILAASIHEQWISDEQAIKTGTKLRRQVSKPNRQPATPASGVARTPDTGKAGSDTEDAEDQDAVLQRMANSGFALAGHSARTARARPAAVTARPAPPPTPEQVWGWAQKEMEDDCEDTIAFGEHDVAASVLYKLNLHGVTGEQRRPRKCENTNNETRIITVGHRVFWTVGLSHKKRRDENTFYAYERIGKRDFRYVAGKYLPRDSNGPN